MSQKNTSQKNYENQHEQQIVQSASDGRRWQDKF
jgi:hypothetical protein